MEATVDITDSQYFARRNHLGASQSNDATRILPPTSLLSANVTLSFVPKSLQNWFKRAHDENPHSQVHSLVLYANQGWRRRLDKLANIRQNPASIQLSTR